jgi:hypothetical protein
MRAAADAAIGIPAVREKGMSAALRNAAWYSGLLASARMSVTARLTSIWSASGCALRYSASAMLATLRSHEPPMFATSTGESPVIGAIAVETAFPTRAYSSCRGRTGRGTLFPLSSTPMPISLTHVGRMPWALARLSKSMALAP